MPLYWWGLSAALCILGTLFLLISMGVLGGISGQLMPLLDEVKAQLQDFGDITTNTVGRAADTMDIVEVRVSQAMGQAAEASTTVRRQALGVGAVLAGLYAATRIVGAFRKSRRRRR